MTKKPSAIILTAASILFLSCSFINAQTYRVVPGDSLYLIAKKHGTTVDQLIKDNGLGSAMIYPGQTISIKKASNKSGSTGSYRVQPGDSLFLIAQRHGTTVEALKAANGLKSSYLEAGQTLVIPKASGGGASSAQYTVQPGDSLFLIAKRYGTTVEALIAANGLKGTQIYPGQRLNVKAGSSGQSATTHTVKVGDTLYLLSKRYGTTVSALRQANGLKSDSIYPGQRLVIPKGSGSSGGSAAGISQSDLELLARLVTAEAGGEPYTGQVAVAATILNRLRDPKYPKTIPGIIYQYTDGAYQYCPVENGSINNPSTASARKAVQDALNGWDPTYGATGFYNPAKTSNSWVRSKPVTTRIGNHVFFKY